MKPIATILCEHMEGTLSPADQLILDQWVQTSDENRRFFEELNDPNSLLTDLRRMERYDEAAIWAKIRDKRQTPETPVYRITPWRRHPNHWMAVAVLIILLGIGAWWFAPTRLHSPSAFPKVHDVAAPARSQATLTLANGQQVLLDSAASGNLAIQGGARILKSNEQLTYRIDSHHAGELLYNTLTNPRGSQVINVALSDGTKVWLNAESSLRYPVAFMGPNRTVEITGEGYFEVMKKVDHPFIVEVENGAKIEVLGTAFNVMAYPVENNIKATLLEGSVRVTLSDPLVGVNTNKSKLSVVLKPGQQAQVVGVNTNNGNGGTNNGVGTNNGTGQMSVLSNVDVEAVLAWKNGLFSFAQADVPMVMHQLARWYDVEVIYEGTIPKRSFNGEIGKNLTLRQVLDILSSLRIHYSIVGNKLTIRP